MKKLLDDVGAMHRKYGFAEPARPARPPEDLLKMRLNFIKEELDELAEATGYYDHDGRYIHHDDTTDFAKALDALVDLMVVVVGTARFFGLAGVMEEAWDRVMAANLAKERGVGKRGIGIDLIKPPGWRPPALEDLVR